MMEVTLVNKNGGMWKIKAKNGYHINYKAKHISELVVKDKFPPLPPSWFQRILGLVAGPKADSHLR